jgi:hypothetical protein
MQEAQQSGLSPQAAKGSRFPPSRPSHLRSHSRTWGTYAAATFEGLSVFDERIGDLESIEIGTQLKIKLRFWLKHPAQERAYDGAHGAHV